MTFKVWYEESTKTNNRVFTAQEFYEAGTSSRQAEIDALQEVVNREREQATEYYTDFHCAIAERDALQKRIDDVVKSLEGVKVTGFRPHCYDYDKGWRDCAITTLNDLKGDKND